MNALPGPDGKPPLVGIVGHAGAYGRWLARFLERRMGLQVRGSDIADPGSPTPAELARQVDVLVFSVPIRRTVAVIESCIAQADGGEAGALWLDLTSIKQAPVAAMLGSRAEVAGLHPMAAPPKIGTLEGRTLAVCRARVARWGPWLDALLAAMRADCVEIAPAAHDRAMALVQGLVHASHLAQADVLRRCAAEAGGMRALHALRTVGHELDLTVTGRILAGNPAIYEDIQFGNPDVLPVLERLGTQRRRCAMRSPAATRRRAPRCASASWRNRRPGSARRRWPRAAMASNAWATCRPTSMPPASSASTCRRTARARCAPCSPCSSGWG